MTKTANSGASEYACMRSFIRWAGGLLFCVLLVLIFTVPVLPGAAQNTTPQKTARTAREVHQSNLRKAEIRQRKIDNPEVEEGANVYRHSPMVHELAHMLGLPIEATSRLFGTVNFILLVIAIVWGIWKVLPRLSPDLTFRARTERIRREMDQARVATEDANRRLASVEERLSRLDSEIESIRTHAEQETANEEKRLRAALEQEKQAILDAATQDIRAATKNAQSQLKKLAADLVIEHARQQIAVTPEADRILVAGFLTDMNDKRPGGGVN